MKIRGIWVIIVFLICFIAQPFLWAQEESSAVSEEKDVKEAETPEAMPVEPKTKTAKLDKASQLIADADALFEKDELRDFKQALNLYEEVLRTDPDNFEANWKAAKTCRFYAEESKKRKVSDWEKNCTEYGKKGMEYAQKAISIAPDKPNGYYFYGLCAGSYSDGVGLITAIREGLKDKTQNNLEKAYKIDKLFENGGPIVAIGRFWQVVPWPYHDEDKALEYFREFQKTKFFDDPDKVETHIYLAEILMDKWGSGPKKEARQLLEEVSEISDDPYWEARAAELLKEL